MPKEKNTYIYIFAFLYILLAYIAKVSIYKIN